MSISSISEFSTGQHQGTCPGRHGGLYLAEGAVSGEWVSPAFTAPKPFVWAVASWNGQGRGIEVQVRVSGPAGWSPWFSFGRWSQGAERHSLPLQEVPGVGRLDTDTLHLEAPAAAWQLRVMLEEASVARLFLSTAGAHEEQDDKPLRTAWGIDLPVPCRSQMVYPDGGRVWCSPTSLSMVMAFWGRWESIPDQVVPGVYDPVYQGHGNWPFNAAYAGSRGFVAYVDRFFSFADLERHIAAGLPVIASVAYQKAWLPNAPIDQTAGHLLVVRGFTDQGDIIVNDPAGASDDEVRRVYPRDLFRRAWLDRSGVVYLIWPEGLPATLKV